VSSGVRIVGLLILATHYRVGCDCGGAGRSGDAGMPDPDAGCSLTAPACTEPACLGRACGLTQVCSSAGQCECSRPVSKVGPSTGRSAVREVGGAPRMFFYTDSSGDSFQYVECAARCDTASPSWTAPLTLIPGGGSSTPARRPVLATLPTLTAVAGYQVSGANLTYGECSGDCALSSSWATRVLDPAALPNSGTDNTLALDLANSAGTTYRGIVTLTARFDGGFEYLECTASGCVDPARWSVLGSWPDSDKYGASLVLRPEGGQLRRLLAVGAFTAAGVLRYVECSGDCASQTSWPTPLDLVTAGSNPSLATTSAGAPRIAYWDIVDGRVHYMWCLPAGATCLTLSQWQSVPVSGMASDFPVLRVGADDRAYVAFSSAGQLYLAIESAPGTGTFTTTSISDCAGPLSGEFPALWLGDADRYRLGFTQGQGQYFTQQSP